MKLSKTLLAIFLGGMTLSNVASAYMYNHAANLWAPTYTAVPGGFMSSHGGFIATPDAQGRCPSQGVCTNLDYTQPRCARAVEWSRYFPIPSQCYLNHLYRVK